MVQTWLQRLALAMILSSTCASIASAQNTQRMYEDAQRRAQSGSWTRGLEMFKEIVALDPELPEAAWNAAFLASKLSQWETCALYYRNYLYRAPDAEDAAEARDSLEKCERRVPSSGSLTITSASPEDLEISVDGVIVGRGTVENLSLSEGPHQIRIEAVDYEPFERTVRVENRGSATIEARLNAIIYYGQLNIQVDQEGAVVALDGRQVGVTPLPEGGSRELSQERTLLTVDKEGFHRWQRYISIPRNDAYELEIRMLPLPE